MQNIERFVVPALGAVVVLSAFILGVPLVFRLLLALLGLAAVGTYFAPRQVQVETRIAIAAVGLLILLIVTPMAFWLTLLSFAAIAALQVQHRGMLQQNPATIGWLGGLLKTAKERQAARAGNSRADASPPADSPQPSPERRSRRNWGGYIGPLGGFLALICVFMPWLLSVDGTEIIWSPTLLVAADELELPALYAFFFALLALSVASMASMLMPRGATAAIGGVGLVLTAASYIYIFAMLEGRGTATILPNAGMLLVALCFAAVLVLQLIPSLNRPRGGG